MSDEREFLEALLLAEHSKAQTMRIVHWIGRDPAKFKFFRQSLGDLRTLCLTLC
jgi:hypothetical protein